ncbi:MAG: mechanosensitive ion channel [Rubricoccaceae bacterium]|nr:mechanosensitive ion channel [Rubricoccaceae bacterium]
MPADLNVFNDPVLWGTPLWRVLAALVIVFAGFASRRLIEALFRFLGRKASGTRVRWDDEAAALLPKPLALVAQLLLWRVAVSLLLLPTAPVDTREIVLQGLYAALLVSIVWVLFRVVDVVSKVAGRFADTTKTRIDDQAIPLLRKTLKVFLGLLGAVFIVQNLGYSVTSVVAGLGIGGLALALAAQDSVANFFGSLVLFTDAPFQVGDYVEVGGISGTVEEVGFRTTRIRQDDSSLVSVPNQTFTGSFITNYSARNGRRVLFTFGLSPRATPDALEAFLTEARAVLAEHDNVREGSIEVHLTGLGKWKIEVRMSAFTVSNAWGDFLATREALLLRVLRLVDALGLSLAHPARTLYVQDEAGGDGATARAVPSTGDPAGAA